MAKLHFQQQVFSTVLTQYWHQISNSIYTVHILKQPLQTFHFSSVSSLGSINNAWGKEYAVYSTVFCPH